MTKSQVWIISSIVLCVVVLGIVIFVFVFSREDSNNPNTRTAGTDNSREDSNNPNTRTAGTDNDSAIDQPQDNHGLVPSSQLLESLTSRGWSCEPMGDFEGREVRDRLVNEHGEIVGLNTRVVAEVFGSGEEGLDRFFAAFSGMAGFECRKRDSSIAGGSEVFLRVAMAGQDADLKIDFFEAYSTLLLALNLEGERSFKSECAGNFEGAWYFAGFPNALVTYEDAVHSSSSKTTREAHINAVKLIAKEFGGQLVDFCDLFNRYSRHWQATDVASNVHSNVLSRDADVATIYQALRDYALARNTRLPSVSGEGGFTTGEVFDYGDQYELMYYTDTRFNVVVAPHTSAAADATSSYYAATQAWSEDMVGTTSVGGYLPDKDNIHILVGYKCPLDNTSQEIESATATRYDDTKFRKGSKRQFIIVYKLDTNNNPYRCIQG